MIFAGYKAGLGCILAGRGILKLLGLPIQQPKESLVALEKKGLAPSAHTSFCESSAEWSGVCVGGAFSIRMLAFKFHLMGGFW